MRGAKSAGVGRQLPLLVTGILLPALLAFAWWSYREVKSIATVAAGERLRGVAREVAELSRGTAAARTGQLRAAAADTAIRAFLRAPAAGGEAPALAVLRRLGGPADPEPAVELWNEVGARVLVTGPVANEAMRAESQSLFRTLAPNDTVRHGPFHSVAGGVHYWVIARVRDGERVIGSIVQRRRIANSATSVRQLREQFGENVTIYFASAGSSLWTDLTGAPSAGPVAPVPSGQAVRYAREGGRRYSAATAPVPGTPWLVVADEPESAADARPRAFLMRALAIAAALTVLGAATAWWVGRPSV
ncbi:MAG: hypothetical protein WKG32_08290 [Gemmatimonadaceae bacterium]